MNMLEHLRNAKEEEGFTLIELIVVVLIIAILAGIAVMSFLNQRKSGYDAALKSDVKNAATAADTWMTKNPGAAIPNQRITYKAQPSGGAGSETTAFISPLSSVINASVPATTEETFDTTVKLSAGSSVVIRGTGEIGEYCIYGYNPNGDEAATEGKIYYDSVAGGLNATFKEGSACPENTPQDVKDELKKMSSSTEPVAAPAPTAPTAPGGGSVQPPMSTTGDCSVIAGQTKAGAWNFSNKDNTGNITVSGNITVNSDCTKLIVNATNHNWTPEKNGYAEVRWQSYDMRGKASRGSNGIEFPTKTVSTTMLLNADATVTESWNKIELGNPTNVIDGAEAHDSTPYLDGDLIVFESGNGSLGTLVPVPTVSADPRINFPISLTTHTGEAPLTASGSMVWTAKSTFNYNLELGPEYATALTSSAQATLEVSADYQPAMMTPVDYSTVKNITLPINNTNGVAAGEVDTAELIAAVKDDPSYKGLKVKLTIYPDPMNMMSNTVYTWSGTLAK